MGPVRLVADAGHEEGGRSGESRDQLPVGGYRHDLIGRPVNDKDFGRDLGQDPAKIDLIEKFETMDQRGDEGDAVFLDEMVPTVGGRRPGRSNGS